MYIFEIRDNVFAIGHRGDRAAAVLRRQLSDDALGRGRPRYVRVRGRRPLIPFGAKRAAGVAPSLRAALRAAID